MNELIKLVVAGWRGAREDRHGDTVRDGLAVVEEHLGGFRQDSDDVLVLSGDNPDGGVDAIVHGYVTAPAQKAAGWKWQSERDGRKERVPGTGLADYRVMMRERDVDMLVLFPGPADAESREALSWAIRYGVPFMGFPIPPVTWGGRPPR